MDKLLKLKPYRKLLTYEVLSALYMTGFMSLFILYLTETQNYESDDAFLLMGILGAIRYSLPIITGKITDLYIETNIAILLGAILQFSGMFLLFMSDEFLIYGLTFVAIGYSFLKPNLTVALGHLCDTKSAKDRDAGFSLFYALGNLGGLIAPISYGLIGSVYGWEYGFCISSICLAVMLLMIFVSFKQDPVFSLNINRYNLVKLFAILLFVSLITASILYYSFLSQYIMCSAILITVLFLLRILGRSNQKEKHNYLKIFLVVILTIIFFAFFEQQFFFLPLFINHYVDAKILGFQVPTPWFNMINPLVVILTGVILSRYWSQSGANTKNNIFYSKFYSAFTFLSLSFFIISYGIYVNQNILPSVYIIISYIFCSVGEILLIPASLSLVSKLSNKTQKSFSIGIFYLTMAFAQPLAGYISLLVKVDGAIQEKIPESYLFSFTAMGSIILFVMSMVFLLKRIKPICKIFALEDSQ